MVKTVKFAVTDEGIRRWILADEYLYLRAREFGGGGDEAMYAALPRFVRENRAGLAAYITGQLTQ